MVRCYWKRVQTTTIWLRVFCIGEESEITDDYQKIPLLWNFSVKFNGSHISRLYSGGHRTTDIETDYYGGFVELETIRILFVISALKLFNVVPADVASTNIQVMFGEKLQTITGQELGPWQGNILIIVKALYRFKSSNFMWHYKLSDNLRNTGSWPCYVEFDL